MQTKGMSPIMSPCERNILSVDEQCFRQNDNVGRSFIIIWNVALVTFFYRGYDIC